MIIAKKLTGGKMKKNIFVFYITLALCFSSCIWPKNEKELPIYKPDVLWTKKIKGCSFSGQPFYFLLMQSIRRLFT